MNENRIDDRATSDSKAMLRAVELATLGQGHVEPNPMVGCLIVKQGTVVGEGYHARFGGPHAEVQAISPLSSDLIEGSTIYITLEPCTHFGKTPPCVDLILKHKPKRVVVGLEDPNPVVAGKGIAKLREHGISVDVGIEKAACERLLRPYSKRLMTGQPWVIAKWAMTLDGRMATYSGDSKWITCDASRLDAHATRGRVDSICVGIETALRDDPLLTARPQGSRIATRIVMDSLARLPVSSQLVQTSKDFPTLICCGPDASTDNVDQIRKHGCEVWIEKSTSAEKRLEGLLCELSGRGHTNILVEGGPRLLGGLFDQQRIDEVHIYIACKVVGGDPRFVPNIGSGLLWIREAMKLREVQHRSIDDDLFVQGVCDWSGAMK